MGRIAKGFGLRASGRAKVPGSSLPPKPGLPRGLLGLSSVCLKGELTTCPCPEGEFCNEYGMVRRGRAWQICDGTAEGMTEEQMEGYRADWR